MNDRVEKLAENCFLVAVPVYFTVTLDENGNPRRVEQSSSDRKWVKGERSTRGSGRAYGKNPAGLLGRAAAVARAAALSEKQTKEAEG